ncbi:MAG TPA: hypothetical protein VJZ77_05910 [Blastocatellia bacterium]|nr:hypothetical protein [Blastocatellia bacterium]
MSNHFDHLLLLVTVRTRLANSDVIEQERNTYRVTFERDGEGGYHIHAAPISGGEDCVERHPERPYWLEITCLNLSQIQAMLQGKAGDKSLSKWTGTLSKAPLFAP